MPLRCAPPIIAAAVLRDADATPLPRRLRYYAAALRAADAAVTRQRDMLLYLRCFCCRRIAKAAMRYAAMRERRESERYALREPKRLIFCRHMALLLCAVAYGFRLPLRCFRCQPRLFCAICRRHATPNDASSITVIIIIIMI